MTRQLCYECVSGGVDCGCGFLDDLDANPPTMADDWPVWQAWIPLAAAKQQRMVEQLPAREMDEQPPLSAWLDDISTKTMTDELYMMRTGR